MGIQQRNEENFGKERTVIQTDEISCNKMRKEPFHYVQMSPIVTENEKTLFLIMGHCLQDVKPQRGRKEKR